MNMGQLLGEGEWSDKEENIFGRKSPGIKTRVAAESKGDVKQGGVGESVGIRPHSASHMEGGSH